MSEDYLPSPEEIKLACKKMQEQWSEKERYKRAGITYNPYEVKQIDVAPSFSEHFGEHKELI